jgi:hypothetical protein
MNRVSTAITRMKKQIEDRIANGVTTVEAVEDTRKALDMDILEFVKFQEIKSLATANGTLTAEEGQLVYNLLGHTPETFNSHDAATKAVLTELFMSLLQRHIGARRA